MDLPTEHPSLRRLQAYWDEKRRGRQFPARADIDPLELGFVLGNLSLIEVFHNPLRFRIRLQGTMAVARLGYDMTGRFADEIPDPEYRQVVLDTYRRIIEHGGPMREVREGFLDFKSHRYEIVWLPLSDDNATINMLMACVALV